MMRKRDRPPECVKVSDKAWFSFKKTIEQPNHAGVAHVVHSPTLAPSIAYKTFVHALLLHCITITPSYCHMKKGAIIVAICFSDSTL